MNGGTASRGAGLGIERLDSLCVVAGEVDPLGVAKLVAHEVEVRLAAQSLRCGTLVIIRAAHSGLQPHQAIQATLGKRQAWLSQHFSHQAQKRAGVF